MTTLTLTGIADTIDYGGYFGGGTIHAPYTVTWTGDPCNCYGNASGPVTGATLEINGYSYVFAVSEASSTEWFNPGWIQVNIYGTHQGTLSTNTLVGNGAFYIEPCCSTDVWDHGTLTVDGALGVPAPIAGEGPVSLLLLLIIVWLMIKGRRLSMEG